MGDAAGKLTNGFHFLSLAQLRFKFPAFRNIETVFPAALLSRTEIGNL
jgi:hypothetical protein